MQKLKYGENPQQAAWTEATGSKDPLSADRFSRFDGTAFYGSDVSLNTLNDWDRAIRILRQAGAALLLAEAQRYCAVVMKHGNACGGAIGEDAEAVLEAACGGDEFAAFGGYVATNFALAGNHAAIIEAAFRGKPLAGIAAPAADERIHAVAAARRKPAHVVVNPNLDRMLCNQLQIEHEEWSVCGLKVWQEPNPFVPDFSAMYCSGLRSPLLELWLAFAWAVGSASSSNTITLVKDGILIGNGVGQQDRVGACGLAVQRANRSRHLIDGAVAYSDSFFPFADGPGLLANNGIKAIFATSGSVRDTEVLAVAQQQGVLIYMVPDSEGRGFSH